MAMIVIGSGSRMIPHSALLEAKKRIVYRNHTGLFLCFVALSCVRILDLDTVLGLLLVMMKGYWR